MQRTDRLRPPVWGEAALDFLRQHTPAALAVYGVFFITFGLAAQSLIAAIDFRLMTGQLLHAGSHADPLYEMGTGLGFWATILFCLNFVLATRWRWVEAAFGGLDRVYRLHGLAGRVGFAAVIAHAVILVVQALPDWSLVVEYTVPGVNLSYTLGLAGVVGMSLLVIATLWVRLPYGFWLNSHKWMIVPFLFGTVHAFVLQGDWYMILLSGIGIVAWVYSTFLYGCMAPRTTGQVSALAHRGGIHDIAIRFDRPFAAEPGQFIYLSVHDTPAVGADRHPFSIAGTDGANGIRLGIKALGDYTEALRHLKTGTKVTVYGPYGRFGARSLSTPGPQLWIAGGIGVTPFLSLLQHAADTQRSASGLFVWSVRRAEDAVFLDDIERLCARVPGLRFQLHVSDAQGFLTADVLQSWMGEAPLRGVKVLICGPGPMMQGLTRQLLKGGLRRSAIHTEEFALRN